MRMFFRKTRPRMFLRPRMFVLGQVDGDLVKGGAGGEAGAGREFEIVEVV